jgi:hypothetical protein
MTIYVSLSDRVRRMPNSRGINVPSLINAFIKHAIPCPKCQGEELILRFGDHPYITCLNCGCNRLSGGMGPRVADPTDVKGYLEAWDDSNSVSESWGRDFRGYANQAKFKITFEGGEKSGKLSVESVDSSYLSKVERLGRAS